MEQSESRGWMGWKTILPILAGSGAVTALGQAAQLNQAVRDNLAGLLGKEKMLLIRGQATDLGMMVFAPVLWSAVMMGILESTGVLTKKNEKLAEKIVVGMGILVGLAGMGFEVAAMGDVGVKNCQEAWSGVCRGDVLDLLVFGVPVAAGLIHIARQRYQVLHVAKQSIDQDR